MSDKVCENCDSKGSPACDTSMPEQHCPIYPRMESFDRLVEEFEGTVWDFRVEVFEKMKALGLIPADGEGPDYQENVDAVMKRLIEAI
jgi:hypothetical protein